MTELQGAVARAQLEKLEGVVTRRRRAGAFLTELLAGTVAAGAGVGWVRLSTATVIALRPSCPS